MKSMITPTEILAALASSLYKKSEALLNLLLIVDTNCEEVDRVDEDLQMKANNCFRLNLYIRTSPL